MTNTQTQLPKIVTETSNGALQISNLRCVDCAGDPKIHFAFDVQFEFLGSTFCTTFLEVACWQKWALPKPNVVYFSERKLSNN